MQVHHNRNQRKGKTVLGIFFLLLGCVLLIRSLDIFFIPSWLFSWPMFLIVIGCYLGSRHGYNRPSAFIPLGLGILFLANELVDFEIGRVLWPLSIIGFGIWMIVGRRKSKRASIEWDARVTPATEDGSIAAEPVQTTDVPPPNEAAEDRIDSVAVFGGVKRTVVSKNFQGGEVVNIFGGAEINLIQADMQGRVVLEVVQVFGGTKIIVPANWTVHSEMAAVFGGIEDKRPPQLNPTGEKVLIIQGTSIFGGIDIKSF